MESKLFDRIIKIFMVALGSSLVGGVLYDLGNATGFHIGVSVIGIVLVSLSGSLADSLRG